MPGGFGQGDIDYDRIKQDFAREDAEATQRLKDMYLAGWGVEAFGGLDEVLSQRETRPLPLGGGPESSGGDLTRHGAAGERTERSERARPIEDAGMPDGDTGSNRGESAAARTPHAAAPVAGADVSASRDDLPGTLRSSQLEDPSAERAETGDRPSSGSQGVGPGIIDALSNRTELGSDHRGTTIAMMLVEPAGTAPNRSGRSAPSSEIAAGGRSSLGGVSIGFGGGGDGDEGPVVLALTFVRPRRRKRRAWVGGRERGRTRRG